MEEKIFIPQADLSFDIQRFAELIDGQYTLEVVGINVTCYFNGITGDSVEVNNNTVTIGGKTFTASNATDGAEIKFTGSANTVTRIDITNVAVTTDNVIYTPSGSAGIAFGADGAAIELNRSDTIKINGITYNASAAKTAVNVTAETITLVSGTISVGADAESLTGKNFIVNDGVKTATFNLQNSDAVTINGIAYKAIENTAKIEFTLGKLNALTGNFEITVAAGKSFTFGEATFTANNSAVTLTYNSDGISVDGVTYDGKGNVTFTDSLVTLDGYFDIGDGMQSLSGKNFNVSADNNVVVKLAGGDTNVTVNGVTYAAGTESVELTFTDGSVYIYGEGAQVSGTGNFVIESQNAAVTINDVAVQSTEKNAEISFGENNTVQSLSSISANSADLNLAADATISNSTLNVSEGGSLTLGGVTYSGTGTVTVNDTNSVTLSSTSGTSMNVSATNTESLKGKNIAFTGEVKINGDTYSSSGSSGSVSIDSTGTPTVSNSSVAFNENTPKTLSIKKDKDLTVGNVTYTAKDSSAQVEVKGTAVKITNGTVAVENTAETYTVDLDKDATAQIGGVNFQKTSDSDSDADINVENGKITLNAGFTVGDGTTPLNGLTVTLTTPDQSTFNLGGGNVTVIQNSGVSNEVIGDNITGVKFDGDGTASLQESTVTLTATDGGNISVSGASVSEYTFTLNSGTYTFGGNTSVTVTSGPASVSDVSGDGSLTVNGTASVEAGGKTYTVNGGEATFSSSGMTSGTYTEAAGSTFTITGDTNTYTSTSAITYNISNDSTYVLNATGTRAYTAGDTKEYSSDTYNVTAGTYSITISNGSGTAVLDSGTATKIFSAGDTFSYTPNGGQSHSYTAETPGVTYNISITNGTVTEGNKSGSGTRNDGTGTYEHTGDNAGTYTLSNGAIMKLTLSDGNESFYSGSATSGSLTSFKIGTNTYTGNATLTLTRSGGNSDTYSLASGSGTRTGNETFTYPPGTGGKSYSGDVTYRLDTSGESLYAATSAISTNVSGDTYAVGNNTYNLTAGTYSLTFSGGNTSATPTLTSATGTTTTNAAFTIKDDSKEYTPLNGSATLTLNINGTNETESFTGDVTYVNSNNNQTFTGQDSKTYTTNSITYKQSGSSGTGTVYNATGTRAYDSTNGDTVTFPYQGNTYTVTAGTYTDTVTSGTAEAPTLTTTTAVFTANTGSTFKVNDSTTYTATANTTFTLNGTNLTTSGGSGTRALGVGESKTYNSSDTNNSGAYTLASGAIMKLTLPDGTETFYSGSATRTTNSYNDGTHTYTSAGGDNLTLTLTKNNGGSDSISFTSGTGTRSNPDSTFTYKVNNTNQTYTSNGAVTYILKGDNSPVETLYKATGYRTNISGESYTTNGHNNYKLTEGTYSINIDNESGADTFTLGKGSGTFTAGTTFTHGGETYTASGNVTLTLDHNNSNDTKDTETFTTGTGTRAVNNVASFTTTDNKTYQTTGTNKPVTYYVKDGGTENVYSATGTRAFGVDNNSGTPDSETDSYKGDTYKVTAGTYSVTVTNGNPTETLTKSRATYSVSNGETFHFGAGTNSTEYTATEETQLTLGYDANGNQNGLTAASGAGTRTATAEDSGITFTYDSDTYNTNVDATIKAVINGTGNPTESFLYGTATHTGDFHYGDKAYTAEAGAEITYNKTSGGAITKTFKAGSAGTRPDSASTFTYNGTGGDNKTYNRTSTNITYRASTTDASTILTEITYAAEGSRTALNDTFTGDWGNVYNITNGTGKFTVNISEGEGTTEVALANATKTYPSGNFLYSGDTYTVNKPVTLSLSVETGTGTETFESGSAQNGDSYIVKTGSQVDIGAGANKITYTATGSDIVTVTAPSTGITALSGGTIKGTFANGQSATIGGIAYKSTGATSLDITDVNTVTASGTFEATGDFATERTLNGNEFKVTSDGDIKATFGTGGVTKIEKLSAGATVEKAGGATTAITDANGNGTFIFDNKTYTINTTQTGAATFTLDSGKVTKIEAQKSNGTFTFGSQTFTIADDATEGVTFTIDPTSGTANKIEGLQRTNDTYAHVTVTDGETTNLYVRRDSDNPTKTNGKWTDKDIINFYYVKYDGTSGTNGFTVQAVDKDNNSTLVNITSDDYTAAAGTPPTLTFSDTSKKIIVENTTTNTAIKVGALDGEIKNTNGNAIRIDANGDFKIGTFSGITFTESKDGNFDVSTDAEFTVDSTGKITVSAKDDASSVIDIEAPTNADIHINTAGTFKVNGVSILQIENGSSTDVQLKFDSRGNVSGIKANGVVKVTVMPTSASSSDLGESADTHVATSSHFQVEGSNLTYVTVLNDYDSRITYETNGNGNLTALEDIADEAIVIISGSVMPNSLTINGHTVNGTIEAGKKIKLNSTTDNYWYVEGDTAPADDSEGYRAVINADNTISLYSGSKQTKNVADYVAVFGDTAKPTEDDGALPAYPSTGITIIDNKLSEIEINAQTSATYKINGQDITIPGRTILKPVDGSFSSIEVDLGAQPITYNEMNFTGNGSTSKATLGSAITLSTNAKVTNAKNNVTFTATGTVTFDDVTIENLNTTKITGVTTNTNNTALTINSSKSITVNGDKTYTIDANADKITGISNGAQVTANGFEIETDSAGTFKVGGKDFVVVGDDRVTFKDVGGAITEISDLSAAGSITGDFITAINVNGDLNAVEVTDDDNIGVVGGSGTVSKLYNVTGNAVVANAGGAATISTDGAGTFIFGAKTYAISAGTADFLSSAESGAPEISGIKNVNGSATVSVYQAETNFAVNGNSITFEGEGYGSAPLKLAMGGDTISTVDALAEGGTIKGLSTGAVVKVAANSRDVQINNEDLNVDKAATVYAAANGYSSITGVAAGATFTTIKKGAIIILGAEEGTFKFGDANTAYEFDAIPTLVAGANNALASIGGLTADQTVILNHQETSGLYIGSNKIKLEGSINDDKKVTFTMGDNNTVKSVDNLQDAVSGLSTGTIVKVAAGNNAVQINNVNLQVDNAATVYAATGGYSTVTGVAAGATFTAVKDGAIIIPDTEGTSSYIFNDKTYSFSAKPTLVAGDENALASIGGLASGKAVEISAAEDGLKVGRNTVKFTRSSGDTNVKLIMGASDTIATVESMADGDEIEGLTAGAVVKGTDGQSITVNTKAIQITGSTFDVHAAANGYSSITGIADNAVVNTVGDNTALLIPNAAGTYKFGDIGDTPNTYTFSAAPTLKASDTALTDIIGLTADQSVTIYQEESGLKVGKDTIVLGGTINGTNGVKLVMNAAGNVAKVENLQGEISGLTSGTLVEVKKDAVAQINTAELQVNQDVTAHVKDNTGYDYVTIKPGAEVKSGKSVSFVTDGIGTYTFGDHSFEISGDTEVTIKTGDNSAVTEINGVASALIVVSHEESGLKINGKAVDVNVASGKKATLKVDANGVVEGIEGLTAGDDLPANITLAVDTTNDVVSINGKYLKTGQEATVHTTADGYDWVSGIKDGANVEEVAKNVSLVTDGAGTFIIGSQTYTTDDAQITLKTGEVDGSVIVTEIAGLDADKSIEFSQDESGLIINGKAVTFTVPDSEQKLKLNIGNNATIASVENLRGDISNLPADALVQAVAGTAVKINNDTDELEASQDVTVRATAAAYDSVTGFTTGATFSKVKSGVILIPDTAGTSSYIFSGKTYSFSAKPTLVAGASNALASIGGLTSGQYVELQAEDELYIGANQIELEGSHVGDGNNKVKFVMGDNNTVKAVENLKDSVTGLSAGALVQVKNDSDAVGIVGINNKALQTNDDEVTVHATANGYDYVTGLSDNAAVTTAVNVSLVTDGAGTFTFDTDGTAHTFTTDDAQITLKTNGSSAVTEIAGLDADKYVEFSQGETNLTVNGKAITFTVPDSDQKLKLNIGNNATIASVENLRGNISGLSAGMLVKVAANSTAQINTADLQVNQDVTAHVKDNTGYDYVTGLSNNAAVTKAQNVSLVTDGAGKFIIGSQTYTTDDAQITLKTNGSSAVTEIAGLDADKYIEFSQDETNLTVNGKAITFTVPDPSEKLKLNIGNNATIESVENLRGNISDLSAGVLVQVAANNVNVNGVALQTTDGDVTVHATADGYDTVTGLTSDAEVTTAKENATLVTDAAGEFTFDKAFTITDDNSVAFVMGADNALAGVYELDGKISGNFTEGLKVDGGDVLITGDDEFDILADGNKVTKIEGLSNGANVQKSGGAETLSTDGDRGTFTFGDKTYAISEDSTADFLSSGDFPVVSGIKNLSDTAKVKVYQDETALTVEDNTLKLGGVDADNTITLTMDGDTIKTVDNVKGEVSGLSAGANVHVATNEKVTVNGLALQISDGDNEFDVTTAANGYAAITGVAGNGLNVSKAVNASIEITTSDSETYVVGTKSYNIVDNDDKVTLVTDGNTSVTAVGGLIGKFKSDATTNKINGANVYSSSDDVWFVATDDNGISKVTDVKDSDTVSVPAGVEVFVTGNADATVTDFTINGITYHLLSETQNDISIIDKKVKSLATNARLTISGAEGNYVVNGKELYITPGRNVVIGEATGAHLYDPEAVDFSSFTPADEIVERVFGENVAEGITPVTNSGGSSDLSGDNPGAVIMTGSSGTANLSGSNKLAVVKAAGNIVNITGDSDSVVAAADVNVNLQSGNSNARLMQTAGTMTVNGYDYSTGAGIQLTNSDVVAAVREVLKFSGNDITWTDSGDPKITITDSSGVVNFHDLNGKKQTVAYAINSGDNVNAFQSSSSSVVLVGSWNGNASANLYGGNGNDTAFGGAGDTFNLGNGENYLELGSNGATVELTATSGNTTVKGFGSSDIVKLNAANAQVYYTADGLIFTNANGQASLSIQDVTASPDEDGATGISYTNVLIQDINSDTPVKTAVAREGMAINATDADTKAYVGNNSGIELNDFSGDIDLDSGSGNFGQQAVTFRGITSIKGGSREIDIIGASTVNNTLEAGTGGGSIWGKGAANDLLIAADSDSKINRTTFIFESGDGNDTISNIQFYDSSAGADDEPNDKMDVVSISGSASTSLSTSGNDVIIKYTDSGDTMTIKDAVNKKFKVSSVAGSSSESLMQIASNEVTFDGSGGVYYATEANASLVVSSDVNVEDNTINLKGGSNYTIDSNINIVDASAATSAINIVGNNSANTLKASSGGSTLFGGAGTPTNDLLIGGDGTDIFRYKNGDGNDTISGVGSGDIIDFYGLKSGYAKTVKIMSYSADKLVLHVGTGKNATLTVQGEGAINNLKFRFSNQTEGNEWYWSTFKTKALNKSGQSFDFAEDYWENDVYANELLDGDADLVQRDSAAVTFDNAENISYASANFLTGDIQFSVSSGEQVYNFSALVDKRNK